MHWIHDQFLVVTKQVFNVKFQIKDSGLEISVNILKAETSFIVVNKGKSTLIRRSRKAL